MNDYLADGSITLIVVDFDVESASGSLLGIFEPAHNVLSCIFAPDNRKRLASNFSIQWDILQ